jgi:hypothetical protein
MFPRIWQFDAWCDLGGVYGVNAVVIWHTKLGGTLEKVYRGLLVNLFGLSIYGLMVER